MEQFWVTTEAALKHLRHFLGEAVAVAFRVGLLESSLRSKEINSSSDADTELFCGYWAKSFY